MLSGCNSEPPDRCRNSLFRPCQFINEFATRRIESELNMRKAKPTALLVSSQPIQNAASLQAMAGDARLDVLTAYCSLPDAKLWRDPEHLTKEAFDLPLLDGYAWVRVPNYSPWPRLGKFYGLINPGIIRLVA